MVLLKKWGNNFIFHSLYSINLLHIFIYLYIYLHLLKNRMVELRYGVNNRPTLYGKNLVT